MSNIKKARYKNPKFLNQEVSVIKFTGTSKNIKQINYFLPKAFSLKKTPENIFTLLLKMSVKKVIISHLHINDWISVTEDNRVNRIPEENFDKIITLVD